MRYCVSSSSYCAIEQESCILTLHQRDGIPNDFAERNRMTAARKTSANAGIAPRVFLSYARSDGEQFAARLRKRLEAKHIPLWQDRIGLEGGREIGRASCRGRV